MRTLQRFTSGQREYTISPEPRLAPGRLAQVLVQALLRDETTGEAPRFPVRISTTLENAIPRAVEGGLAGLAGIPDRVFAELQASASTFSITIEGERSVPVSAEVTIGPQAGFPGTFLPVDLGVVDLHRTPVVISGRTVRQVGAALQGIAGVAIRLTGLWRQLPPGNVVVAPDPPNFLFVSPGVHLPRTIATGQVRAITLNPVAGDTRDLTEDYNAGSLQMRVSNRNGMGVGDILEIDPFDPGLSEFLVVQSVAGAADPALPATVTLLYPGRVTHRRGTVARRVNPAGPGPDNALTAEGIAGDQGLVTAAMAGLAGSATVELHGGAVPAEYQRVAFLETTSDAEGYFRLPPLSRAGQINLSADNGVDPPVVQTVVPDYSREQQTVNFHWS